MSELKPCPLCGGQAEFMGMGDLGYTSCYSATEVMRLQAENAKLRELVKAAWGCIHTGASCSDCRLIAGGCTLQTAMHKLGIEVKE